MKYIELVKIYEELEETSGRLDKVEILSKFLKKTKDLEDVVHLLQGRVFSRLDERKIGMSSRLVLKVISKVVGVKVSEVEKKWREVGDLGKVVEELKKKQSVLAFNDLTVKKVVDNLRKLSELEGKGSISRKIGLVVELLNNSKEGEGKFIVRTVLEDLRIGVAEGVLRDSISKAFDVDVEEVEKLTTQNKKIIPEIDYANIKNKSINDGIIALVKKRGCVVIRNVFEREKVIEWNYEIERYIDENNYYEDQKEKANLDQYFSDLKSGKPQIFGLYWSKPQIEARQSENMGIVKFWLNNLWTHEFSNTKIFIYRERFVSNVKSIIQDI